ncbi:hypothetical protein RAD16_12230 [Bradyrhizobium sp. 18BD]
MTKHIKLPIILTALLVAAQCLAAETKGAGSTFVSPVMTKWIDAYKAKTGNVVSYQAVGSSIGVGLIQAAASSADWKAEKDFHLVLTNAPGEDAYPITATTFVLMPKAPKSPERSAAAIDFVRWSLERGRTQAERLNYVPLPTALVDQIERYWQQSLTVSPAVSASACVKR